MLGVMTKHLTCLKCGRSFRVEGASGSMEEAEFTVTCPYEECREERNRVDWPMDGSFKTIPMNKHRPNQT